MSEDLVRCFVCVEVGEAVRKRLESWVAGFGHLSPEIRWVKENAFHITLKFCGEIPYSMLYKLESALEHGFSLKKLRPFVLELSGIGAFPGFRRPRVLWAGVGGEDDQIQRIAAVVERAGIAAGLAPERRSFHPHVTIARIPASAELPVGVLREINSRTNAWGEWEVSSVALKRSELLSAGPRYTNIAVFDFTNDREVQ
ncbi:MAG: RNA 2',3'-cyclic phosphodiesterase [Thermovirgaceae bacterium]|nr:RNA 2',3'-cyclic phosphodiesterase [Thermovirgaceae bacterium]